MLRAYTTRPCRRSRGSGAGTGRSVGARRSPAGPSGPANPAGAGSGTTNRQPAERAAAAAPCIPSLRPASASGCARLGCGDDIAGLGHRDALEADLRKASGADARKPQRDKREERLAIWLLLQRSERAAEAARFARIRLPGGDQQEAARQQEDDGARRSRPGRAARSKTRPGRRRGGSGRRRSRPSPPCRAPRR